MRLVNTASNFPRLWRSLGCGLFFGENIESNGPPAARPRVGGIFGAKKWLSMKKRAANEKRGTWRRRGAAKRKEIWWDSWCCSDCVLATHTTFYWNGHVEGLAPWIFSSSLYRVPSFSPFESSLQRGSRTFYSKALQRNTVRPHNGYNY